jgi:hypothetical protein
MDIIGNLSIDEKIEACLESNTEFCEKFGSCRKCPYFTNIKNRIDDTSNN